MSMKSVPEKSSVDAGSDSMNDSARGCVCDGPDGDGRCGCNSYPLESADGGALAAARLTDARAAASMPLFRASPRMDGVGEASRSEGAPVSGLDEPESARADSPSPSAASIAVTGEEPTAAEFERASQPWLIPYKNPLDESVGREFFRALPKTPGIYKMLDESGFILYVGKAKSLKNRLNSYRQAKPGAVSRKVLRLLKRVRSIDIEHASSEAVALLMENELLRELRPPYNSVNTSPESYFFLSLRVLLLPDGHCEARLRLTTDPRRRNGEILYGAFKGRGSVREGYFALLRMMWASQLGREERFSVPSRLLGRRIPPAMTLPMPRGWITPLKHFLQGTSDLLLAKMSEDILACDAIPRFAYGMIQQDLETLKDFFERVTRRNRLLRLRYRIPGRLIPQELIDDLIVLERHGGGPELISWQAAEGGEE